MEDKLIKKLISNLEKSLPGIEAQIKMAHADRMIPKEAPSEAKLAAVLLLLVKVNKSWHVLFVERVGRSGDVHSNQIAFPGGKMEITDATLLHTALRETWEEIGIPNEKIRFLGRLTPLYIPVSNFHMHPFVGVMDTLPVFTIQPNEIKQVFTFPLIKLKNPNTVKITDIRINEKLTLTDIPYYDVNKKVLWGATAMVISEFLNVLK
jgi:8-oxo-dGTP pyrophosphatase MutT (NUDIX family)